ncbi:RNA polymerase sigma factor [Mucilaginibacter litoreus]|uniref:RNA polymerase sigma factor n=1 Tax=Mucilaginibacter litoreus TaxID=1048221 RepID=A0ABW3AS07_9SPHI
MISKHNREAMLTELYKSAFPAVAKYISKMGGSFDDAKDIFQDALVIYYEKAIAGDAAVANKRAYLVGIAKHLWLKKFNAAILSTSLNDLPVDIIQTVDEQVSANKVLQYLQTAGKRCMDLLSAFYYDKLPMKDVAGLFGYSGERSVTVQKYKCLEKVRETVKQQSLSYADFIE